MIDDSFQIIFKVADNQDESQIIPSKPPAINTPRKTYELSSSDVIGPIEDVRAFHTSLELASHKRPVVDEDKYRDLIRRGHQVKQEASTMSSSYKVECSRILFTAVFLLALLR